MENKNETFTYTYSAKQQEEINEIRQKYLPAEESKMDKLRKLDESATKPGMIAAMSIGIIGTLLLGVGMCCTMLWAESVFVLGVIVEIIGILLIIAAYPVFTHITAKRREKLTPQILKLTEELSRQK